MTEKLFDIFVRWLPMAIVITLLCGLVYVVGQQNLRQSANNPQIQMAEDAAAALAKGASAQSVLPPNPVDIASSLSPYLIVLAEDGHPWVSSAVLNGVTPVPPAGVFAYTRTHGEDRLSWQPQSDVRSAIIVVHFQGQQNGFVIAGRSLREVERQEGSLLQLAFMAWLAGLGATLLVSAGLSLLPWPSRFVRAHGTSQQV